MTNEEFLQAYADDVYHSRDPEAPARFIADPCLRHEAGELITMSLTDNRARIAGFLERHPTAGFRNRITVSDGEFITSCYEADLGGGQVISGIEVFRIVDGRITETWNSHPLPGAWG
jgi:hypothetical protein